MAAATGSQQTAAPEPTPNPAPACARATLDPQLLRAARRGDSKALEELLLQLNDDDESNEDQQDQDTPRSDDEGNGTPTTGTGAAASTTTTGTAAAPSTSMSQAHVVVEVDPRRPHADAVAAAPLPPPPVPVIEGEPQVVVVEQATPDSDDASALPAWQPPAAPPAAGSAAVPLVLYEDGVTMEGDSLLHVVAASGNTRNFLGCVHVIVRNKEKKGGADAVRLALEARNNKGDTPLHCAARAGNANMIGFLVDRLAETVAAVVKTFLDRTKECEETELQQAVSDATEVALKAFVRRKNKCGETALHQAVRAGSIAAIGKLLAVDPELAALSQKEDDAGAASKAALLALHPELAAYIGEVDDAAAAAAAAACSPFFLAVSLWGDHDDKDIARHLFRKTSPSIRSNVSYYCSGGQDGRNVLHAAVSRASVKTVILLSQLLTSSAGPPEAGRHLLLSQLASQRDKEKESTPLHLAASLDGLPSSLLICPPHVQPPLPETTPLWPSSCKRTFCFWFCWFPVRITRRNSCAYDAASVRAHRLVARPILWGRRYWQILPLMLSLVLNANEDMAYQPDKAGMYPIHVAARSGSVDAVEMLLERCPDCATLRDAKGRTLLHVAAEEGRSSVVKYVCRQSQLKVSHCQWRACCFPAAAASRSLAGLLSSILNAQDMNGDTALHRAVQAAQLGVVRRLIGNKQVRLDVPNNEGKRPIDVSWSTLPREAYYAWDPRMRIRGSLLRLGAPYGENNRGDLFRKNQDDDEEEKKMSEHLTSAAQVLGLFSVLITTVTYASAFTLPGGNRSPGDGGVAGTPVLGWPRRSYAFEAFILADALAFGLSLLATSLLLYAGVPTGSLNGRFRLINLAYGLMWHSGRSLLAAFGLGLFIVLLPVARSIAIAVAVLMILLALGFVQESEGFYSLGNMPMIGIGRRSRQLSPRDRMLRGIIWFFTQFLSYVIIFGFPAILELL